MRTIYIKQGEVPTLPPLVATIGFFDGVHRGHQFLINQVIDEAKRNEMESAVITFDAHPRQVLQYEYQPELLSTLEEKLLLLSKTHVENVIVLHFDKSLATLSARNFMDEVLSKQLNVKELLIGYDNRFGHNRQEGFDDYVRYGHEIGIKVLHTDSFQPNGERISSSLIRRYIMQGEMEAANRALGYAYSIKGKIVKGYQNGHKLGFPTANLDMSSRLKLIPASGVYAVKVRLEDSVEWKRGMMNIGIRPTFNGSTISLEVNIFNLSDNLYDQTLCVSFVQRIRKERKFESLEALSHQLEQDKIAVNHLFDAID